MIVQSCGLLLFFEKSSEHQHNARQMLDHKLTCADSFVLQGEGSMFLAALFDSTSSSIPVWLAGWDL